MALCSIMEFAIWDRRSVSLAIRQCVSLLYTILHQNKIHWSHINFLDFFNENRRGALYYDFIKNEKEVSGTRKKKRKKNKRVDIRKCKSSSPGLNSKAMLPGQIKTTENHCWEWKFTSSDTRHLFKAAMHWMTWLRSVAILQLLESAVLPKPWGDTREW
jgi:hypothetical protein